MAAHMFFLSFPVHLAHTVQQEAQQESNVPQAATGISFQTPATVPPPQNPNIGISVAESFRRVADRYVNNPGSLVSAVHLEPGPSGGFQVIIMLQTPDLL